MQDFLKAIRHANNRADYVKLCEQFKNQLNQLIPGEISSNYDQTLLHCAAALNNVDLAEALIAAGALVDIRDKMGCTPLHRAAYRHATGVMKLLIKAGADISAQDTDGVTPLHRAAQRGFTDGLRLLVTAGVDMNSTDYNGAIPLHYINGTALNIHEMLCHDEAWNKLVITTEDDQVENNTTKISDSKNTALQALLFLLENNTKIGAVDATDSEGNTTLIKNVFGGDPAVIAALVTHGANVNHVNAAGETALHHLIKVPYSDTSDACMEILLKHNARLDLADNNGHTPLDLAKITRQRTPAQRLELVKILEHSLSLK